MFSFSDCTIILLILVMLTIVYSFFSVISTLAFTCACAYISFPFFLKLLPSIIVQGTFLNLVCSPRRISRLHKPREVWKLEGVKNYYLPNNCSGSKLGVWHLTPTKHTCYDQKVTEVPLSAARKIIIYCHGNVGHRCFGHRKRLYAMLRNLGFHVIAFDYRGYGDSDGWPTEDGVVQDTITVYEWVLEQAIHPECKIIVWGHSLGTAIASQALLRIQVGGYSRLPSGIILEAPFTNAVEAMMEYPLSRNIASIYPGKWMERIMTNALSSVNISFLTIKALPQLSSNVLILHAKDDNKVNFKLGKKLYEETKKLGGEASSNNVTFAAFKEIHRLGHSGIWQHPELPSLIEMVLERCSENRFYEIEL